MEVNTTMVGVLLRDSLTLGCKSLTAGNRLAAVHTRCLCGVYAAVRLFFMFFVLLLTK